MRQLVIYGLILMALTLLSAMGYIVISGRQPARPSENPREDVVVNSASAPSLEFSERQRTYNSEVNRLIDRFIRTTKNGQYSEFRKMWTRKLDPISAESYERIYGRIKQVRVLDVSPPPDVAADTEYVLTAEVHVGDADQQAARPVRTIRIRIVREDEGWVFAPLAKTDDASGMP